MNKGYFFKTNYNGKELTRLLMNEEKEKRLAVYAGIARAFIVTEGSVDNIAAKRFTYDIAELGLPEPERLEAVVRGLSNINGSSISSADVVECASDFMGVKSALGPDVYEAINKHNNMSNEAYGYARRLFIQCKRENTTDEPIESGV